MSRLRAPARALALAAASAVAAGVVAVAPVAPAQATPWPGHPDRSLVRHQVQAGDTATGLAVRYHAWTAELLRQPPRPLRRAAHRPGRRDPGGALGGAPRPGTSPRPTSSGPLINATTPAPGWRDTACRAPRSATWWPGWRATTASPSTSRSPSRGRKVGWQQHRVSGAGALGVMQVLPDTGRWMRWYAGRPLRLRDAHDNVQAGGADPAVLRAWTRRDRVAVAAYYEGLGAVRQHGWYADTKAYVRSVYAIERRLRTTGSPV